MAILALHAVLLLGGGSLPAGAIFARLFGENDGEARLLTTTKMTASRD
jgi:hypothetical protein